MVTTSTNHMEVFHSTYKHKCTSTSKMPWTNVSAQKVPAMQAHQWFPGCSKSVNASLAPVTLIISQLTLTFTCGGLDT